MSADTTTGMLITKRRDGQPGNEYRVAWAQNIGGIMDEPNYPPSMQHPILNRKLVRDIFAKSEVHFTEAKALVEASAIEGACRGTEYGIVKFDFSSLYFPASERRRKRRSFRRRSEQRA